MIFRIQDLHTFFIVARSRAMHIGAEELGITPGAISQRIRTIEEKSGKRLFNRSRSGLTLTQAGEQLYRDIKQAFQSLEEASDRHLDNATSNRIRVTTCSSFATSTLVPHLGDFSRLHPHVDISIETVDRVVDLRSEPIDIAFRHGLGSYPGLKSEWIVAPKMIVVAAPSLLAKGATIKMPEDCLHFPLIQDQSKQDWPLWFKAQEIDCSGAHYGPSLSDSLMLAQAAVSGQGLALINDIYVSVELANKSLVRVLDCAWPTQFAYYAVGLPAAFDRPVVRKFVAWTKSII